MTSSATSVKFNDVQDAYERISGTIKKTQVFVFDDFNSQYGRNFYFKAESMQLTGSFKIRGALNAVLKLIEKDENVSGVVTHSSGNFGRALAWITRRLGLNCCVVCPTTVPDEKLAEIRKLGAETRRCEPTPAGRMKGCRLVEKEKGYQFISTSGTMALEFLDQVPELDAILIPVSGGGMIAGICVAAKAIKPEIKIHAVEPVGKDLEKCLKAGERLWPNPARCLETVADGMRMQQLAEKTWPIVLQYAEKDVFTIRDKEAIEGMKYAFSDMKLVVEPSAGTAIAAAMSKKLQNMEPELENVGVILCGGNADINHLPWQKT